MSGIDMIAAERERHALEGWTGEHDDGHDNGELRDAAMSYLFAAAHTEGVMALHPHPPHGWPFRREDWKPSPDELRNLVKAGALIAAEIDRVMRARAGRALLRSDNIREPPR